MSNDVILPEQVHPARIVVAGQLVAAVAEIEQTLIALPEITDQASRDAVHKLGVAAGRLARDVDAQRQNAKAPFMEVCQKIDNAARPIVIRLTAVKEEARAQEMAWLAAIDRQRVEAARAALVAQAAAAAALRSSAATGAVMAPLQMTPLPPQINVATRQDIELEIYDLSKIPLSFFDLNQERVKAAILAGQVVPGVNGRPVNKVVMR